MGTIYVRSTGNDSTGTGSAGNPYATPGKAAGVAASGDLIDMNQAATFTFTSTTANVAGGRVSLPSGVLLMGAGSGSTILDAGALTSFTMLEFGGTLNGSASGAYGLKLDGKGNSSVIGVNFNTTHTQVCKDLWAHNCTTYGFQASGSDVATALGCKATSCGSGFFDNGRPLNLFGCVAISCTNRGFYITANRRSAFVHCIAAKTTSGPGFDIGWGNFFYHCTAYGNSSHGFSMSDANDMLTFVNCVTTGNGGYGFGGGYDGSGAGMANYLNCAGYNNTSGFRQYSTRAIFGDITLSGDPFASTASDDYSPNATAGAGALLRAAGFGPYGQSSYADVGAVQHQDSGGGVSGFGAVAPVGVMGRVMICY